MRRLSFIDDLSGVGNRRGFFLQAERRLSAASESGQRLTVTMAVVDHLQDASHRYGRAAGTELIRDAARVLTATFGPDDVIARLGGGEFAVLSVGTPPNVRERLEEEVSDRNTIGERPYPLVLMVGVAHAPAGDLAALDELIAAADADLHARHGEVPGGPPPVRTPAPRSKGRSGTSRKAA